MAEVVAAAKERCQGEEPIVCVVSEEAIVGANVQSCGEDEGYETPGKKELPPRQKNGGKETRKPLHSTSEDDGYETGGKKQVSPRPKNVSNKEGRKARNGGSPRAELHPDQSRLSTSPGKSSSRKTPDLDDYRIDQIIDEMEGLVRKDSLNDSALQLLRLVPDGYIPLPHQVGGHRHIDGKLGFLRRKGQPHLLYKPVQAGSKGVQEVSFYDALYGVKTYLGTPSDFPSLCRGEGTDSVLRSFTPMYYGLASIADRGGKTLDYLVLEDITHRFTHPCIIDLKMGQRVWDDLADNDKIEREKKKYPAQETLGFRIIGMRVYRPSKDEYVYYDRFFGRSVTESTAMDAVSCFFDVGDGSYRTDIINGILTQLTAFVEWMDKQNYLSLFATSLLIVYEGGPTPLPGEKQGHLDMRLVDFAHTYEKKGNCSDSNAIFGVRMYTKFLKKLYDSIVM